MRLWVFLWVLLVNRFQLCELLCMMMVSICLLGGRFLSNCLKLLVVLGNGWLVLFFCWLRKWLFSQIWIILVLLVLKNSFSCSGWVLVVVVKWLWYQMLLWWKLQLFIVSMGWFLFGVVQMLVVEVVVLVWCQVLLLKVGLVLRELKWCVQVSCIRLGSWMVLGLGRVVWVMRLKFCVVVVRVWLLKVREVRLLGIQVCSVFGVVVLLVSCSVLLLMVVWWMRVGLCISMVWLLVFRCQNCWVVFLLVISSSRGVWLVLWMSILMRL